MDRIFTTTLFTHAFGQSEISNNNSFTFILNVCGGGGLSGSAGASFFFLGSFLSATFSETDFSFSLPAWSLTLALAVLLAVAVEAVETVELTVSYLQ